MILNAQNPVTDLSKKYVAISFHIVREAVAAGIIESYWLKGAFNMSNIMTKQAPYTNFKEHINYIYWRPGSHIHNNNRLEDSHIDTD